MHKKAQNLIEILLIGMLVSIISLAVLAIYNQQKKDSARLTDIKVTTGVNNRVSENSDHAIQQAQNKGSADLMVVEVGGSNALNSSAPPSSTTTPPGGSSPTTSTPSASTNTGSEPAPPPNFLNPANFETHVFGPIGGANIGQSGLTSGH